MKGYAPIFLERFKSRKSGVIKRQQQEKGINDYIATCLSRNYYVNTIVFRGQQKCITMMYDKSTVFWDFLNYTYNADKLFF